MTTYVLLSNAEKLSIIESHIRSNEYNLYNVEMSRVEEAASASPDQARLDTFDLQISEYHAKIAALVVEKAKYE